MQPFIHGRYFYLQHHLGGKKATYVSIAICPNLLSLVSNTLTPGHLFSLGGKFLQKVLMTRPESVCRGKVRRKEFTFGVKRGGRGRRGGEMDR